MPQTQASTWMLFTALGLLVPIGVALLAIGAAREERAEQVAATALIALATAVVGYLICGFAFQFGGVALVSSSSGLKGLTAEWSPLDIAWGPGWGLVGLRGFLLRAEAYQPEVYALFASQLPAVITTVLVALLALCQQVKRAYLLPIGLLISGLVYPLFGNWVWGGGWLSRLGQNVELGHGLVDAAGSGAIFLLGTLVALAGFAILKPRSRPKRGPARLPPIHFPLLVVMGALLATAGWPMLALGNPLVVDRIAPAVVVLNLMLAAAGGALAVAAYSWFVTGQPNALAIARGTVAGLVAAGAACAFVPAWAALCIGAIAGILLLLALYVCEQVIHLDDPSAAIALFGLPAVWSLLAVPIFADGRWGTGWNGTGLREYAGVVGQGVSGLWLASGYQSAGAGQLYAQLTGLVAAGVVGGLVPWALFRALLWLKAHSQLSPATDSPAEESAPPAKETSPTPTPAAGQ